MPEIHYKFKSSLSFEIITFSEPTITVGTLKDLINQKQSIKTSGFDLKLKDSHGKVYTDDEDIIDSKSQIIVSRVPKISRAQTNMKKKETHAPNIINEIPVEVKDISNDVNTDKSQHILDEKARIESVIIETVFEKPVEPQIPEILKCCLCKNLMKDAMQIKCCKKNYCHECITGYLFDPDISGSLECPDCKSIVSNKDANLTDNSRIRSMIYDFKQGKLDCIETLEPILNVDEESLMHFENVHEVEIELPVSDNLSTNEDQESVKCFDNIDSVQPIEEISPSNTNNDVNFFLFHHQPTVIESIVHNSVPVTAIKSVKPDISVETNNNNDGPNEVVNQIEQHYQGHSYNNNLISMDQQFSNRPVIPVINTPHIPDIKLNSNVKDSSDVSIHDLEFDPVMYMKFLKIVGENYPDELSKILSNNNDSLYIPKESRKSSNSNRRPKKDEYYDKHVAKKSRYELENDEGKYKKSSYPPPVEKHSDNRYYDNVDKKSSRARSRSKEHYVKKPDSYPSNRSRDYDGRDREYYSSTNNGSRYRSSDNVNYQDDRHNKYRSSYNNSLPRLKSNTYKRPMDR